jgi:hypothetical protein
LIVAVAWPKTKALHATNRHSTDVSVFTSCPPDVSEEKFK